MLVDSREEKSRDVDIDGVDGSIESGEVECGDCAVGWNRCRNCPQESLMCRDVMFDGWVGLLFSGTVGASVDSVYSFVRRVRCLRLFERCVR